MSATSAPTGSTSTTADLRAVIVDALGAARERTLAICDQQSEADQQAQHSPLMSPMVWDLAHIGNYEELWLLRALDDRAPIDATLDDLYNAFEHPRWERPSLPILGPTDARAYDARVREAALELLSTVDLDAPPAGPDDRAGRLRHDGFVYGMVIQHEHQHCETLLATSQLMGERAVPPPGTTPAPQGSTNGPATGDDPTADLVRIDGAQVIIGTDGDPWAYDNERGAHEVALAPYALGRHPVTNRQWRAFIADGGYDDERHWSPEGWAWRTEAALTAPEFWRAEGSGAYSLLRFGRRLDVDDLADEPVQHVCFHEAEAFCAWSGTRLPTEAEWEAAATWDPVTGTARRAPWGDRPATPTRANLGQRHDGPAPVGTHPGGVSATGVAELLGDVWEWTSTTFAAYPGFESFPYAEYSEVFFGPEYRVLRGGSWAADPVAVRSTFRNWDYPIRRQIFSGLRVAKDA